MTLYEDLGDRFVPLKENIISFYEPEEVCTLIAEHNRNKKRSFDCILNYKCTFLDQEELRLEKKTYKKMTFRLDIDGKFIRFPFSFSYYFMMTKTFILKDRDGTVRTFSKLYSFLRVEQGEVRECLSLGYKKDFSWKTDQEIVLERDVDKILDKLKKSYEDGSIYEHEYKETVQLIRGARLRNLLK
ncbi:hypothetical protein [Bacillus luti]|uniref:hypothetical protein n=1 Tax=Bacillus luti TaxID=2026191 RepID=UPI0012E8613B|nr:hypothetical protein [Bacillus luti]